MVFLFIWLFTSSVRVACSTNAMIESTFHKHAICNVQERNTKGCSVEMPQVQNLPECLSYCGRQGSCRGASMDYAGDKCFLHQDCVILSPCDSTDKHDNYWYKDCLNGQWDSATSSCKCLYQSFGARCEKCVKSCQALTKRGYSFGEFMTYLDPDQDKLNPFVVFCYIRYSTARVMLASNKGGVIFNRTWAEYVNGFHDQKGNYWLGLTVWHALNKFYKYRYVRLNFNMDNNKNGQYCQTSDDFSIGDEGSNFAFTYSNVYCGAGDGKHKDCLGSLKNVPFSTWDRDNDEMAGENVAGISGSGWWYRNIATRPCNLLGVHKSWVDVPFEERFSWIGIGTKWQSWNIRYVNVYFTDLNK